jgi:hypothetical protein
MRPGTYVLLITSPLNVGLNYLFVYTFNLSLIGAPLATGISYWLSFLLLVLYSRFVDWLPNAGVAGPAHVYHNMSIFARLAILGVVHVGTEWWAFEIVALAAGRLGTIPSRCSKRHHDNGSSHEYHPVRNRRCCFCSGWQSAGCEERKRCGEGGECCCLAEYGDGHV